jgi:large subunit ribosomal protein L32
MTPLPKRKISTRRKGKRRASINIKLPHLGKCDHCGKMKKAHVVCPSCGFYKNKEVIHKKVKKEKKTSNENSA